MVSAATNLGANAAKRYLQINTSHSTRATEELSSGLRASNPSYDPSSSAVGYQLGATISALGQASRNVSQAVTMIQMATGSLGATQDILTRMKELTVAANTNTVGQQQLAMMDQEFQQLLAQVDVNATTARWGGVSLFTGGAGATTASGSVTQGEVGLTAQTNAFAATLNAASRGMIDGIAQSATVTAVGSLYNVQVVVGNQTFAATVAAPTASGTLSLTSTTDSQNIVVFDYAAAVGNITNAATFQSNLRALLGLGGASKAQLTSASAAAATGFSMSAGAGVTPGLWAVRYGNAAAGQTGTFSLSNGKEVYTANVTSSASMTGTVSFSNGMTVTLSAFDGTASFSQEMWSVAVGSSISQNFQYAEKSSDVLNVTFNGATASALGLTGLSVATMANAVTASNAIDNAQQIVGAQIAQLGGKASQLNFMSDTLLISIQNQSAAKSTFVDADIADSMETLQRYKGLAQVASTVFTQALNDQSNLTDMVKSVR